VRTTRPRVQRALAAGSVVLALLATCVYAAAAGHPIGLPGPVALRQPDGGPISPSIGPPAAVALLSRIQHVYRHAPGVELAAARTAPTSAHGRRFLITLHNGTVTGEAFIGPRRLALVERTSGPTFLRAAGAHCWRRLSESEPRTLLNVGAPFPENGKLIVESNDEHARQLTIETHTGFWHLASRVVPSRTAYKSFLTVRVDPATYVIRSISVRAPDHAVRATLTVMPLTAAPSIPNPTPAC
jgi:hypothetical protein